MLGARERIIDLSNPGWVHCISQCVRRTFLAGIYICEIAVCAVKIESR